MFLVPYRWSRRGLLVYLWSVRLSVCLCICLSFRFQFSGLLSAVDEDIQLKFDIWLHLNELQTKFEFRYAWPTPLSVFRTFVCSGSRYSTEIWYMTSSQWVTDQVWVSLRLTYFWLNYFPWCSHLVFRTFLCLGWR
jgi:hypothetical protein